MTDAAARRRRSAVDRDARVLTAFLALLVARERGGLLEVRVRRAEGGMLQRFHRAGRLREAADELLELGARTDVYVGCAPRLRLAGDRGALGAAWVLWVDCDGDASVERLAQFVPAPAVVVRSGTASNVHAYWPLVRPLAPDEATAANRQLAALLVADGRSADATRILRVPGTRNFKHDPPRAVVLERFEAARRFTVAEVVGTTADGHLDAGVRVRRGDRIGCAAMIRCGAFLPASTCRLSPANLSGATARSAARFMRTARRRCTSMSARSGAGTASVAGVAVRSTTWPPSSTVSRRGVEGSCACASCCSSASRSGRRGRRADPAAVIGWTQAGLPGGAGIASVLAHDRRGRPALQPARGSPRLRLGSAQPVPGVVVLVRAHPPPPGGPRGYQQHQPRRAHRQPDRRSGAALAAERHVGLQAARRGQHAPQGLGHRRVRRQAQLLRRHRLGRAGRERAPATWPRAAPSRSTVAWSGASGEADGGGKRQAVEIIADVVQFLGAHRRDEDDAAGQAAAVAGETS